MLAAAGATVVHAQTQNGFEFERAFGGTNADFAHVVKTTSDGGYVVGGYSFSDVSGNKTSASFGAGDFWIVKLDANGNKQWDRAFGGTDFDRIADLQQTSDGGYILGGTSYSGISGAKTTGNFGDADFWIVKLDASGAKQWEQTYGGSDRDELRALQQTTDGGYIVGGISVSGISGNKTTSNLGTNGADYWVLKLDVNGNKQWEKTFGGLDDDDLRRVQQTSDGGYIVGGHSFSGTSGNKTAPARGTNSSDFWVVKLDGSGNKQWDKTYGGSDSEQLFALQQTRDGGFIFGGSSSSTNSGTKTSGNFGSHDFWIVKTDASGAVQWNASFGGSDADELYSAQQTSDGGYILAGVSYSPISGNKTTTCTNADGGDYWLVKIDANGAKQWEQSVRGTFVSETLRLQLTQDNGYIVAGLVNPAVPGEPDYAVAKLRGPLRISSYALRPANVFDMQLPAISGTNYVLEVSTNLTQWTAARTNRATNGIVSFLHTNAAGTVRCFYRVQQR
jgi:hypothetical protein